jgi:hypothetical protein
VRDIDYAAKAVNKAIVDKFERKADLAGLTVTANEKTITVRDGDRTAEGTRDDLLAALRGADSYENLWELLPVSRFRNAAANNR